MANPWNINSIYALQYFNCPMCAFKNRSKQQIVTHAYQVHPESVKFLSNINDNSLSDVWCPWKEHFIEIEEPVHWKHLIDDNAEIDEAGTLLNVNGMIYHKCDMCNKAFPQPTSLKKHVKYVHGGLKNKKRSISYHNSAKQYQCEHCEKSFKQSGDLKKHIKEIHLQIKDNKCNQCPKAFARPYQLKKHIQEVHEGLKNHKCETCGKCFSQSSSLKTHINMVHEGVKYKCKDCDKTFNDLNTLKKHFATIHEIGTNIFQCDLCDKSFALAANLKQHKTNVHSAESDRKFKCTQCDSSFCEEYNLKYHINKFHDLSKKHICECGKGFADPEKLKTHAQFTHGGLKNTKKHICDICGKVLSRADKLKIHMLNVHEINIKDFKEAKAKEGKALKAVKNNHICKYCDKAFTGVGSLKSHVMSAHEEEHAISNIPGKIYEYYEIRYNITK